MDDTNLPHAKRNRQVSKRKPKSPNRRAPAFTLNATEDARRQFVERIAVAARESVDGEQPTPIARELAAIARKVVDDFRTNVLPLQPPATDDPYAQLLDDEVWTPHLEAADTWRSRHGLGGSIWWWLPFTMLLYEDLVSPAAPAASRKEILNRLLRVVAIRDRIRHSRRAPSRRQNGRNRRATLERAGVTPSEIDEMERTNPDESLLALLPPPASLEDWLATLRFRFDLSPELGWIPTSELRNVAKERIAALSDRALELYLNRIEELAATTGLKPAPQRREWHDERGEVETETRFFDWIILHWARKLSYAKISQLLGVTKFGKPIKTADAIKKACKRIEKLLTSDL